MSGDRKINEWMDRQQDKKNYRTMVKMHSDRLISVNKVNSSSGANAY